MINYIIGIEIYALIFILAVLAIGYAAFLNVPQDSTAGKEAVMQLGATSLFAEYEKNEKKADKKFIGKIMDIEGQIMGLEKDEAGKGVVILDSGNGMDGIMCTLENSETSKMSGLKEGQNIKIRGKCAGKMMDVVFNKCLLLE